MAIAWTSFGPICCHLVESEGLAIKGGSELAFVGALKCNRSSGRFTERVAGKVADTR